MCKCEGENCTVRKQICQETQKAIDEGKEPKGYCPQCPCCVGNCIKLKNNLILKSRQPYEYI